MDVYAASDSSRPKTTLSTKKCTAEKCQSGFCVPRRFCSLMWRSREQVKIHGPPRFVDDEILKQVEDPDEPDWSWPTKQKFQPSEKGKGEFCLPREDDDSITPQTEAEKGREAVKSTTSAGQSKELAWGLTWKKDKRGRRHRMYSPAEIKIQRQKCRKEERPQDLPQQRNIRTNSVGY
jgi:hypothetical protein